MKREKTVVIVQSNYIPWKGYFDLIRLADEFVLLDDVQYTRRDWRNRNQIKTPQGLHWLTIPVDNKGKYHQRIDEVRINDKSWAESHWDTIRHNYARAAHFADFKDRLAATYEKAGKLDRLSDVNRLFLETICGWLGITTKISWSTDYPTSDEKSERLVVICKAAQATRYISGPAAKDYLRPELFQKEGMELAFMDYSGYPEYPQLHGKFEHGVTVLDLILNTGAKAPEFLKNLATLPLKKAA